MYNDEQILKRVSNKKQKQILYIVIGVCCLGIIGLGVGLYFYLDSQPLIDFPNVVLSTEEWTSKEVVLTVETDDSKVSSYYFECTDCQLQDSEEEVEGIDLYEGRWQESNQLTVNRNGTFLVKVKDINGRESQENVISVSNIDKEPPTIDFESSTTVQMGSNFSVRNGVQASDNLSGLNSDYTVTPDTIDTSKEGQYTLVYSVFDKAGNFTEKSRNIIVQDIVGRTYYRYRTATFKTVQCDPYLCKCITSSTGVCPSGYTMNDQGQCCQTCYNVCKETIWSEWSEWSQEKVTPNSTTEVETMLK